MHYYKNMTKKYLLLAVVLISMNGISQTNSTQTVFANRVISTKNYVINDRVDSYSFRGVFTLNKRELIKNKIDSIIGKSKMNEGDFIWNNDGGYSIILSSGEIKFDLQKSNDNEFYYLKMKELERELKLVLDNPGPKNIAISTKSYVLNDNVSVYSLRAVFHNRKNNSIRELIEFQFGKPEIEENKLVWNKNGSYKIELLDGVAKINLGKSSDNDFYYNKVKTLGNEIISSLN